MSASQDHGLEIERQLKQEFHRRNTNWMPSRLPIDPDHTARFDVPGYGDPYGRGIPTSIKSAKLAKGQALVCMADATRIADLGNFDTTRLFVALYQQEGDKKVFREIREYLVLGDEWKALMGGTPAEAIASFGRDIKVKSPDRARAIARQWKHRLATDYPQASMRWNPKIDSKNQRRLQCSLYLSDLERVIADKSRIKVFGAPQDPPGYARPAHLRPASRHLWGDGLRLPLVIDSPPRRRRPRPAPDPAPRPARALR